MTQERELSRYHCITEKVDSPFGTLYTHTDIDKNGSPAGVAYSYHSKFEDTEVGNAIDALAQATRDSMKEVKC